MKVGILGGGQLALMLLEAGERLGIDCSVFVESKDVPAAKIAKKIEVGEFNTSNLKRYLSNIDICLFESEFIDVELLRDAASGLQVKFYPGLECMQLFQDKLRQKEFCTKSGIPTSPYLACYPGYSVEEFLKNVKNAFAKCVIKWAKLGYDGKGNFVYDTDDNGAASFIESAHKRGSAVYAEKFVPFDRELAIIGCRSVNGDGVYYPVVISEQKSGICLVVKGPAEQFGISKKVTDTVVQIAKDIGHKGNIIGSYGVELFQIGETVMVNEIAPRVHNTGHYTQDAGIASQFENHLRAATGMSFGSTAPKALFAMRNILGSCNSDSDVEPVANDPIKVHWYGKKGVRPGRKLGHLNVVANTPEEIKVLLEEMEEVENRWQKRINE